MLTVRKRVSAPPVPGLLVACDTETTGLSPWKGDRPFAFSFCNEDGETRYVEFKVDPFSRRVLYDAQPNDRDMLRRFFTDPRIAKVFWNAKFDVRQISFALDIKVAGDIHEGMFAGHCCNSSETTFQLKPIAKKYAGVPDDDQTILQEWVVVLRRHAKARGWKIAADVEADYWLCSYAYELLDPSDAAEVVSLCMTYAVTDAERTMLMWLFYVRKMEQYGVRQVYDEEMRLWPVVTAMEDRGVRVDLPVLEKLTGQYAAERDHFHAKLMAVGEQARKQGYLDTRYEGTLVQAEYSKRGLPRRYRVVPDGETKAKWFKPAHVVIEQFTERGEEVGAKVTIDEPFKQREFNPGSDAQLGKVLYDYLALPVPYNAYKAAKRKTAARPVDADTLMELSAQCPLVDDVLKWRGAEKALDLLGAYEQGIEYSPEYCCYLLHADFNQVGPKSGRFSCRRPNLQQSATKNASRAKNPIDTRAPFGPRPGCIWFCIDYSQVEVRIFADLSEEAEMNRIIRSGSHIHKACADRVWGYRDGKPTPISIKAAVQAMGYEVEGEVSDTPLQAAARRLFPGVDREVAAEKWLDMFEGSIVAAELSLDKENSKNKAKLAVFTKLFGGGMPSIMNLLKCSREDARAFLDEYSDAFPDMDPWIKRMGREARSRGYAETAYGRRVVLDDPDKSYRAVNYIVQGSAADLMKRGMRRAADYIRDNDLDAGLVMTIHDELVFEFAKTERKMEHVLALQSIMEDHGGVFKLDMPTEVKCVRHRWCDKLKLEWVKHLQAA